jgi:hypothetical protein
MRGQIVLLAATALAAGVAATAAPAAPRALFCPPQKTVKPFLPWSDSDDYTLMPNGSAESTSGWRLTGGARQVAGNEPFYVNAAQDRSSLLLPAGASATTPSLCFTLFHPTMRFFAVRTSSGGYLRVEATTPVLGLLPLTLLVANVPAQPAWQPTPVLPFLLNLTSPLTGPIQFRLTAVGGSFQVDDVYLDPVKHR